MKTNKFKYSCADFTFPLLSHDSALKLIGMMGIEAVDLGVFEDRSHQYPSEVIRDPAGKGRELYSLLEEAGLEVSDVFLQTGAEPPVSAANDPDELVRRKNRDTFLKIVEYTRVLRCKHITGLPGVYHPNNDDREDWDLAIEEAEWRVGVARDAGLTYAVEAHLGSLISDVTSVKRFLKDCPDLSLTLDYGHFAYQGESDSAIHSLVPYATHIHARGGAKGKLQTTVKENQIDFEGMCVRLKEMAYSGYICLEYVYQDWEGCNRTDNISETLLLKEKLEAIEQKLQSLSD